jgi:hypothetical protein
MRNAERMEEGEEHSTKFRPMSISGIIESSPRVAVCVSRRSGPKMGHDQPCRADARAASSGDAVDDS